MKERSTKFIGAILAAALLISQPLAAQENGGAAANRHSLWKVEGKSNVVYLLGSIHLLKAENFPLAPPLETAYSNAQVAVFETDVEKAKDPLVQQELMTKVQLPAGETLKQRISAENYAAFTKHAKEIGAPMESFETMRPAMAGIVLGLVEVVKMGADPENGLDKYFADKAHKDGKQIIALESLDFQINLLTGFTREEDDLLMKISLKDIDKTKEKFGEMVGAWQTGDTAGLQKFLNETLLEAPSIHKRLVTDRNKNWLPKIQELLVGGKNAIVIVGVGHLVGDEGVVELLKKKGIKVTQL